MLDKTKQTSNNTEYRIYTEPDSSLLANKLLDLFVQAFIKTELDNLTNQRSNRIPLEKEDENNE